MLLAYMFIGLIYFHYDYTQFSHQENILLKHRNLLFHILTL